MHMSLLGSAHRTADPSEADYFYVPLWDFHGSWGNPELYWRAQRYVMSIFPFWNARRAREKYTDTHGVHSILFLLLFLALRRTLPSLLHAAFFKWRFLDFFRAPAPVRPFHPPPPLPLPVANHQWRRRPHLHRHA